MHLKGKPLRPATWPGDSGVPGGFSLAELLVACALLGLLVAAVPTFLGRVTTHVRLLMAQTELTRDGRNGMEFMVRRIQEGKASTAVVDAAEGNPPLSRLTFWDVHASTRTFWQDGRRLYYSEKGQVVLLSKCVHLLTFSYGNLADPSALTLTMSLEQSIGAKGKKARQTAREPVRFNN